MQIVQNESSYFLFRKMLHNNFCVQKYVRNYLFCENIFEISRILVLQNNAKRNFAFFNFAKQPKLGETVSVSHHFRVSRK